MCTWQWMAACGCVCEWMLVHKPMHAGSAPCKLWHGYACTPTFNNALRRLPSPLHAKLQVPYSGFGMMSRVLLSVACSRVLRVACFMCTVLPNPIPGCYARRFPPPPDTVWATIRAGYTTIRGFGGCNDLIFSGHGAFWVLTPLMFSTYCPRHPVNWLLWLALAHASLSDVVYQQHYSVGECLVCVKNTVCCFCFCARAFMSYDAPSCWSKGLSARLMVDAADTMQCSGAAGRVQNYKHTVYRSTVVSLQPC